MQVITWIIDHWQEITAHIVAVLAATTALVGTLGKLAAWLGGLAKLTATKADDEAIGVVQRFLGVVAHTLDFAHRYAPIVTVKGKAAQSGLSVAPPPPKS